MSAADDIVMRLSYRIGYLKGLGFPWYREDRRLHEEAREEIERLRKMVDRGIRPFDIYNQTQGPNAFLQYNAAQLPNRGAK